MDTYLKQKSNDSEYNKTFKPPQPLLEKNENLQKHTLYKNVDARFQGSLTRSLPESMGKIGKPAFPEVREELSKQSDFLTSYQLQFNQEQLASIANRGTRKIGVEREQILEKSFGLKSTGKFELPKHDKNASHLYYLLETQKSANEKSVNETEKQTTSMNEEEHFKFGTYHWKRSDVTKSHHPGLAYR